MISISVCMIVKNEEDVLGRCLESVRDIADEIVVVDTGSTDKTRQIAAAFTSKVYDFPWTDDFASARNFSFSKATRDYCLWLDADDVLLPEDREKLIALKETLDPEVDMVMMKYNTAFDEGGHPTFSYYRERLIRRDRAFPWVGEIHEVIVPAGKVLHCDIAVTHRKEGPGDPDRNLRIFEGMLRRGKVLEPRQQFYYARELYYHARYPEAIAVFTAFLDGGKGWVENNIDACRHLALCYDAVGDERNSLRALWRSLEYDSPRAEICCDIGAHLMGRAQYGAAVFWYELAATRTRDDASGAFVLPDCYDFIPYLQLCVCHDRLGHRQKAEAYNELAAAIHPDAPAVLHNRAYFAGK
ncbi:tetratricopeptide repeat-containing glycosyltransferase family 2 protein [Zongyangia hominis]|uniref:Glycosyltransferase family 2 protein n=1 Tax=Zongyangia hominis TaxID=2763677 RepID=A0A926IBJ0_9FIRM|nr:glycosyltransferase family 2 protein [Zongyangia hominis]MBC8570333.1 glycosyltransferase family 2 protein [Zongyangia hominis]